jgi:multisubunit Na+/H+ antiporter MnhB subunit
MPDLAFELLLAVALIAVAARALYAADLFTGVVHFIIFGLLMALAWALLGAPDIALAEAAIGAGLTGALLLDAVRDVRAAPHPPTPRAVNVASAVAAVPLAGVLLWAVVSLPGDRRGLTELAAAAMREHPVSNAVTGVLLDFRAYDTWLEVTVLLAAVVGALAVRRTHDLADVSEAGEVSPVLRTIVGVLAPLMLLVTGYLLWIGTHAPGGAFQAGAVLAASAVLLFHAGVRMQSLTAGARMRALLIGGTAAFLVWAIASLASGRAMLTLPPYVGGAVILLVEAFAALAIGITLAALFLSARPAHGGAAEVATDRTDPAAPGRTG